MVYQFNFTYKYIDDILLISSPDFKDYLKVYYNVKEICIKYVRSVL